MVWDVVICGGGMAGLTLALQLRRDVPEAKVAVVERTPRPLPRSCHKIGESNAELGSLYMDGLGLREYLRREHVVKLGLRFFPGSGHRPLQQRTEIGPVQEPVIKGYQLDRGRFEEDLRAMIVAQGVTLWEGAVVRDVEVGEPHRVEVEHDGQRRTEEARWIVDATGRSALLRRKLEPPSAGRRTQSPAGPVGRRKQSPAGPPGRRKQPTGHEGNAAWFRVDCRILPEEIATERDPAWMEVPLARQRWRSTNHLTGNGYWVWIIGLAGDRTSVGVVTHDAAYKFDEIRTIERMKAFLAEHEPGLSKRLEGAEVLDFGCINRYGHRMHGIWSVERYGIVGDAAAFTDPLYSPGTDFIALSNTFTVELVRADRAGEDLTPLVEWYEAEYQALVTGSTEVYRQAAPVYAHPRAMVTKIYYDNFSYWSYNCQYFIQQLYRLRGEPAQHVRAMRRRYIELSGYVQSLLRAWATVHPEEPQGQFLPVPSFPSLAIDAHLDLDKKLTADETRELMAMRLEQAQQMVAELAARLLMEYGPEQGAALLDAAGFASWDLALDPGRAEAETTIGLKRRKTLSKVVRDVERSLGRVDKHPQWSAALNAFVR
jgi:flavin-dependent dehydrogenase